MVVPASNLQAATETPRSQLPTQALRLGWLTAELLGLLRQNALDVAAHNSNRKKRPKYRRLSISDRPADDLEDELTLCLPEFAALAEALGTLNASDASQPISALINQIRVYLDDPRHVERVDPGAARYVLERWSLESGARLAARDAQAGRAFGAGASIADTYWHMAVPSADNPQPARGETWKRLLDHRRMDQEAVRIQELAPALSPLLTGALAASLRAWGIAERFEAYLQPTPNASGTVSEPPPEAVAQMHTALRRQARNWRRLIMGERLPEDFLTRTNRHWRTVIHWGTAIVLEAALVLGSLAALAQVLQTMGPTLWADAWTRVIALQPGGAAPTLELKDVITSVALLGPLAVVLWNGTAWLVTASRQLFAWTQRTVTQRFVNRALLVPWTRYIQNKP